MVLRWYTIIVLQGREGQEGKQQEREQFNVTQERKGQVGFCVINRNLFTCMDAIQSQKHYSAGGFGDRGNAVIPTRTGVVRSQMLSMLLLCLMYFFYSYLLIRNFTDK